MKKIKEETEEDAIPYNNKRRNRSLVRFLQSTQDQVVITDVFGQILFVNDELLKATEYTLDEVMGKTPSVWGGNMSKHFYNFMWNRIKNEKQSFSTVVTNQKKNGEKYNAHLYITPVLDSSRKIKFFVGIEKPF